LLTPSIRDQVSEPIDTKYICNIQAEHTGVTLS
jgi:hypothetical protein